MKKNINKLQVFLTIIGVVSFLAMTLDAIAGFGNPVVSGGGGFGNPTIGAFIPTISNGSGSVGTTTTWGLFDTTQLFSIGTTTGRFIEGSSFLTVLGTTTVKTPNNTIYAFRVKNSAGTDIFSVDTLNASSTVNGTLNAGTIVVGSCTGCSGTNPNLIYTTIGTTKYYTASSTATDNLSWSFKNGFISNASSSIVSLQYGNATGTTEYLSGALVVNAASSTITNLVTSTFSCPACVANSSLANSTISGVALGGTLFGLSATNPTLTFSATYTGAAAQTVGLNLGNSNAWTAGQTFTNATSTAFAVGANGLMVNAASSTITQLTVSTLTLGNALTVANGGTGAGTFTSNGVLYGNGTGALNVTGQGGANTVLTANAGAPSFSASPTVTNLTTTASTTLNAPITLNGSATSTQDFTVLGKFANKLASSTCSASPCTIDWNKGTNQYLLFTTSAGIDMNSTSSNPISGMRFIVHACNNGAGNTITFGSANTLMWTGSGGNAGATTTMTSTANQCQDFGGMYNGVTSKYAIMASTSPYGAY